MIAPTLTTDVLTLRAHNNGDFGAYAAFFASARAAHMGGPIDARAAWGQFCKDIAQWSLLGHGAWAIDTADGAFVGQISLSKHPYFPELELGWLMLPAAEGRSLAFEAARTARDWVWSKLKPASLVSYIHRDNTRSRALATRLGAALDQTAEPAPYADHVTYRHPAGGSA